jgi:hypothetical protein
MPMIGVVIEYENSDPYGSRYSGAGLIAWPGQAQRKTSTKLSERCSGTNAPSTTMSLLPVPRSPTVSQTSSIT